jgi:hypothetical protein
VASLDSLTKEPLVILTANPVNGTNNNIFDAVDSSFETGIGSWIAVSGGATPVTTTTQADDQLQALQLQSNSTSSMKYGTATGSGGILVLAGLSYVAMASFRASTTGKNCTVSIFWYKSTGAASSITPSVTGTAVADTTTGWVQASVIGIAPSDAVFAQVQVTVATVTSGQVHYLDEVGLFQMAGVPVWSIGGYDGLGGCVMEYQGSDDGGSTWNDLRFGASQVIPAQFTCNDYEMGCGVYPSYNMLQQFDGAPSLSDIGTWSNGGQGTNWIVQPTNNVGLVEGDGGIDVIAIQPVSTITAWSGFTGTPSTTQALGPGSFVNPVTPGLYYSAMGAAIGNGGLPASTVTLSIVWFDGTGLQLAGPAVSPAVVPTTSAYKQLAVTGMAPAGAVFAALCVTWTINTGTFTLFEGLSLDQFSLAYNPNYPQPTTEPAGWNEPTPWTQRRYRVRSVDVTSVPGQPIPGAWSNVAMPTPQPSTGYRWYVSDPLVQGSGVGFDMESDWQPSIHEESTIYYPLGRAHGVKATTGTKGIGGQIEALVETSTAWQDLAALLQQTGTLMVQTPIRKFYIVLIDSDRAGDALYQTVARPDYAQFKHQFQYMEADTP